MLHRRLPDRLLIAVAALLSLALASPWATAAGADVAQVTVVSPGGAEQTLALDALAGSEDVVERTYALRSSGGESSQTVTGFSLAAILDAAGADPYGFSYLEVQRPAGGAVQLSRDLALDQGAFADGPPVVYATPAGTGFLRPGSGPDDANATDSFVSPQGLSLVLRKGSPLQVRARASKPFARPGQKIRFSATIDRAGAGESLAYSWYFDDGTSATGPEATHSFAKRGSYDVVVGVTTEGNDTGTSAVVTIQVGAPIAGPDRKGGGTNDNSSAPDHGAADGPSGSGSESSGAVGSAPADTQRDRRERVRRGTADRPQTSKPTPNPPPGERVEGELLSDEVTATTPPSERVAARRGHLQGDGGSGGVPGAAWGILATLGLLGAGALLEARGLGGFSSLFDEKSPSGGGA